MRGLPTLLVLALLLPAGPALAGSEKEPEIVDAEDADYPSLDLLAAWFEHHPDGVKFTLKVAAIPQGHRDDVYWVSFRAGGEPVFAVAGFDGRGQLLGYVGPPQGGNWNRGGFERVANGGVIHLEARHGAPAYVSGVVPWGTVQGLEEGVMLIELAMGCARYHRASGSWEGGIDRTRSAATFVAEPPRAGGREIAGWIAGLAVAAAGTGMGIVSYRHAQQVPPPAPPPTAPAAPAPEAARPETPRLDPRR